jgi:hypothetical protein
LKDAGSTLPDQTTGPSTRVISQCFTLLESRNLKPFGAAQIIEYALSTSQQLFSTENGRKLAAFFLALADDQFGKLVNSASARYLLSALGIFGSVADHSETYERIWQAWVAEALKFDGSQQLRNATLVGLISQSRASTLAKEHAALQDALYVQALGALSGKSDAWDLLATASVHHALHVETGRKLAVDLVNSLSKNSGLPELILKMLETIAKSQAAIFAEEPIHTELISQLLALSEINDSNISPRVFAIRSLLDDQTQGKVPVVDIIQSSLERAGPQSLG